MRKTSAAQYKLQDGKNSNIISGNSGKITIRNINFNFPDSLGKGLDTLGQGLGSLGKAIEKCAGNIPLLIFGTIFTISTSSSTNIYSLPNDVTSRTAAQVYQCKQ